jgi:hypothetical protein
MSQFFSTQHHRAYGILRQVVVRPESSIFQIAAKSFLLIQGIIDGLPERLRCDSLSPHFFDLLKDPLQKRRGLAVRKKLERQ